MNLAPIQTGDIVRVDVRGRRCLATVEAPAEDGQLAIRPHIPAFTWRTVTARQVVEHYRRMGRPRAPRGVQVVTTLVRHEGALR